MIKVLPLAPEQPNRLELYRVESVKKHDFAFTDAPAKKR